MAEVKNTFIQSKMNQDLDGRILPNGQYRYGKNISISRSESADVGALENVLGTNFLTNFGLDDCAYEIIGHFADITNDIIYVFITDYTDNSVTGIANDITGQNSAFNYIDKNCFIGAYNTNTESATLLVGGDFLNFSKTFPITGVNLLEDLLFWTDNRNQPRKINVNSAFNNPFILGSSPGYYTNEDQISVAKYYPWESILLLDAVGGLVRFEPGMKNKTERWLPPYCAAAVDADMGGSGLSCVLDGVYTNIEVDALLEAVNAIPNPVSGNPPLITNVQPDTPVGKTTITFSESQNFNAGEILYFRIESPDWDDSWPGDETFLSDKFVRFSYRFEFDDGEFSLMAPFTQACFIPKQDGYFIGNNVETLTPPMLTYDDDTGTPVDWPVSTTLIGDEGKAYSSSIVEFFENQVQDININIPAPTLNVDKILFSELQDKFKVKNIEIIYKESDVNAAYVLDTISAEDFSSVALPTYTYNYQSRKPWKTLVDREIIRVYDKVPIKALAQETSGNRVIYGNYVDKHTSPDSLSYVVGIDPKPEIPMSSGDAGFGQSDAYIRKEYPNHTVKQNRSYQVGVVLSDRYGRQSDVILSDVFNEVIGGYGSTIFHEYRSTDSTLIDNSNTWYGDQINMIFHQGIPETINKFGYPGLYRNNDGSLIGLIPGTSSGWNEIDLYTFTATGTVSGATATFDADVCCGANAEILPNTIVITSSSGEWIENEPVTITSSTGTIGVATGWTAKTLRDQNTLGWYSWKIVVKQTEQDYYNCYLPGMLAGYPKDILAVTEAGGALEPQPALIFPKGDERDIAHVVLINDNINKIPRDLNEVGPVQRVFGSSVKLFGRVENYKTNSSLDSYNRQYDPKVLPDTVVTIGDLKELGLGSSGYAGSPNTTVAPLSYPESTSSLIPINFYNGTQNPLVATVSTKSKIGWASWDSAPNDNTLGMIPMLSVYETEPVDSNLDVYWETTTSGLISELNYNIENSDNTTPCSISDPSIDLIESTTPGDYISDEFEAITCQGVGLGDLANATTVELVSVINDEGAILTYKFELEKTLGANRYTLKTALDPDGYFLAWNNNAKRTYNFTFKVKRPAIPALGYQAIDIDVVKTIQIQNDTPDQIGMYDTGGGNNARTDICNSAWGEKGLWQTQDVQCDGTGVKNFPDIFNVGAWQYDIAYGPTGSTTKADNVYYSTFGESYVVPGSEASCFLDTDSIGLWNTYQPKFGDLTAYSPSNYSALWGTVGVVPQQQYLNRVIKMINEPSFANPLWDGVLKAFNGAYGTTFGTPFPYNPERGVELVFTVARAYQVSAFFPIQTGYAADFQCPDPPGLDQVKFSMGECVFADGPPDPNGLPTPVLNLLPGRLAPSAEVAPSDFVEWVNTTSVPSGPIYRTFENSSPNVTDPADFNGAGQGEATVGQRYNLPNTGHSHYWESIENCIATNPSLTQLQTPGPGVNPMPNPTNKSGFWYVNYTKFDNIGVAPNKKYAISLGLAQASGFDNPGYSPQFRISQTNMNSDPYQPQTALLKTDSSIPIPPGRYVVTVRATDRSLGVFSGPSGDGLYFEWDIPVVINGPFCSNYGSYWTNTAGAWGQLDDEVNTFHFKNL